MNFSLIIPVAADHPEYSIRKPYWMDIHPSGNLMLFEAISGLNLQDFDSIYITILQKHMELYDFEKQLIRQFEIAGLENKIRIVLLDSPTRNQPETVAVTIEKENINGAIVIKDADNHFECNLKPGNFVCTYPLDALKNVNPADKSYIDIDDNSFITNIVEKKIISRWFCTGAYGFEDSAVYLNYFNKYLKFDRLYLSHLIYGMLLDHINYSPVSVFNYLDWGKEEDWNHFKKQYQTILLSFDLIQQNLNTLRPLIKRIYESEKITIVIVQGKNQLSFQYPNPEKILKDNKVPYHHYLSNLNLENLTMINSEKEIVDIAENL